MSRFQIGLGLLALLLLLAAASCSAMERTQQPIADAVETASRHAMQGDLHTANLWAAQAERDWYSSRTMTAALADHAFLEDIDALFAQLPCAEDSAEYAARCAELARRIRAVAEAHQLTIGSFF